MELEERKDVHTEHCCHRHGCKYSDPACTVIRFDRTEKTFVYEKSQSFPCEYCLDGEDLETAYLLNEMYDRGYSRAWDEANSYMREYYGA